MLVDLKCFLLNPMEQFSVVYYFGFLNTIFFCLFFVFCFLFLLVKFSLLGGGFSALFIVFTNLLCVILDLLENNLSVNGFVYVPVIFVLGFSDISSAIFNGCRLKKHRSNKRRSKCVFSKRI